jgi:hypothetical protein
MDAEEKLRAHLISIVQELPMDKLTEFNALLEKIGAHQTSRERTLSMAGVWSELDEDLFSDLTEHLHDRRSNDRSVN